MIPVDSILCQLCEAVPPLVDPFDPLMINPASVDLCFGSTVATHNNGITFSTDISDCKPEKPYYLKPNTALLVSTLETIRIPLTHVGIIRLKSSAARQHLILAGAEYFDPGFEGVGTLGVFNASPFDYPIWPGRRFCQLYLMETSGELISAYAGKYQGQVKATGSLEKFALQK